VFKGLECMSLPSPTILSGVHLCAIGVYIAPQFSVYHSDYDMPTVLKYMLQSKMSVNCGKIFAKNC